MCSCASKAFGDFVQLAAQPVLPETRTGHHFRSQPFAFAGLDDLDGLADLVVRFMRLDATSRRLISCTYDCCLRLLLSISHLARVIRFVLMRGGDLIGPTTAKCTSMGLQWPLLRVSRTSIDSNARHIRVRVY